MGSHIPFLSWIPTSSRPTVPFEPDIGKVRRSSFLTPYDLAIYHGIKWIGYPRRCVRAWNGIQLMHGRASLSFTAHPAPYDLLDLWIYHGLLNNDLEQWRSSSRDCRTSIAFSRSSSSCLPSWDRLLRAYPTRVISLDLPWAAQTSPFNRHRLLAIFFFLPPFMGRFLRAYPTPYDPYMGCSHRLSTMICFLRAYPTPYDLSRSTMGCSNIAFQP